MLFIKNDVKKVRLRSQARIQTVLHRFTEIGQIFQMTQHRGKWHFIDCENLKTFASGLLKIRRSDSSKPVKFFRGSSPGSIVVMVPNKDNTFSQA